MESDQMINTIMQWSNVNSHSFNLPGLEAMASILSDAFSILDCERYVVPLSPIERIDSNGNKVSIHLGSMLRFCKRPNAPFKVLLAGHMDTVYPVDHPFQKAERKSENELVGPGVTDMKGGLCIMLESLKRLEEHPKRDMLGYEVLINPDEEIGSLGSAPFMEQRAKEHHIGLIFEPSFGDAGNLVGARKGSGKFTFVVRGRAAHAGRDFTKGKNAINALAKIIQFVESLNGQREHVTLNVGHIEGGSPSANIVPELAIGRVDVRFNREEDEKWVLDLFKKIANEVNKEEGLKVEIFGKFTRKPKHIIGNTKKLYDLVQKIGKDIGQTLQVEPSGGVCDGNNFSAAGLPNIDSLGAVGGKFHTSEEYCLIDGLSKRVELTTAILSHFCENGINL